MTKQSRKQPDKRLDTGGRLDEGLTPLIGTLRQLIADSRQQVLRAVDAVQVQTYWHVGRYIVECEQGGAQRAAYGQRLLPQRGQALSAEVGRSFDATNLRDMRGFYLAFPIRDAVRRELSWTRYRLLRRVDSEQLFASKYRLVLPSEEELRLELQRDREALEIQESLRDEGENA
ncbi:DUF1016 N-terminal domain-containing protein [Thauera sp.]|uniref:DUF1016 N-terminal domain-containing protein n=1 Tax=Thauera sp. TaxID=1905334 RepID=UPI002D0D34C2|nr:DUF1016 N-terminal domain-containing protein [Thauera sp.]HRO36192.1 DUF1016 N-terminal domain-containing protein [Thauera sp.]